MRFLLVALLLTLSLHAFEYGLTSHKVTDTIYCFFGKFEEITKENNGNMVNSCYVKTTEGFVVIDAGPTYRYAKEAYDKMQYIAKLPVKYVITTHEHDDHWLGNGFYKEQGALLIGPRTYEQKIANKNSAIDANTTRMSHLVSTEAFKETRVVALDSVVDQNETLTVGNTRFIITRVIEGKAHTDEDLIVYLPTQKAVFTGDLVFNQRITSMRDGSLIGSLKALDVIDALHPTYILTGHGTITDATATSRERAYLSEIKTKVSEALNSEVGIEEITEKIKMPDFKKEGMYQLLHNRNLLDAYTELEMSDEDDE